MTNRRTSEQVREKALRDPRVRREWERTALARAVALELSAYRARHDMTQRQLAEILGWRQPRVAKVESGDHNPTVETLAHLSACLGIQFNINIAPADCASVFTTKRARSAAVVASMEDCRVEVSLAVADRLERPRPG